MLLMCLKDDHHYKHVYNQVPNQLTIVIDEAKAS